MTASRNEPVICACSWRGEVPANGRCPSCGDRGEGRISAVRLVVLRGLAGGAGPVRQPMMRRALVKLGVIKPVAACPAPTVAIAAALGVSEATARAWSKR